MCYKAWVLKIPIILMITHTLDSSLLAGVFETIGYPHSLNPSSSSYGNALHSIEMLYMVPRILMGILAVVDTFLVYKIAERRYNRIVALIAAVLFAVMPLSLAYQMDFTG